MIVWVVLARCVLVCIGLVLVVPCPGASLPSETGAVERSCDHVETLFRELTDEFGVSGTIYDELTTTGNIICKIIILILYACRQLTAIRLSLMY